MCLEYFKLRSNFSNTILNHPIDTIGKSTNSKARNHCSIVGLDAIQLCYLVRGMYYNRYQVMLHEYQFLIQLRKYLYPADSVYLTGITQMGSMRVTRVQLFLVLCSAVTSCKCLFAMDAMKYREYSKI